MLKTTNDKTASSETRKRLGFIVAPLLYAPYAAADEDGTSAHAGKGAFDATMPILALRWSGRFIRPTLSNRRNGKWRFSRRTIRA